MRELSLNVLDIAQNSIVANADLIEVSIFEDRILDEMKIAIVDNGKGMSETQLEKVRDPFYTTRTTRKVGLGIPLYRMTAEMTGGKLSLESKLGKGTTITATFSLSHIDRPPLGDINSTIVTLIRLNPSLNFVFTHSIDGKMFAFDTREVRAVLEDVPLDTPDVCDWIADTLDAQTSEING